MVLDATIRDWLVLAALAIGLIGVILAIVALRKLARARRELTLLSADGDAPSFLTAVARKTEEVAALRTQVEELAVLLERTRTELGDALRHVSVVHYDAFDDLGGRLSFSAAILDDDGDGIVLTSIHARSETRSYVKGIRRGTGDAALSPEELQAVEFARRGVAA